MSNLKWQASDNTLQLKLIVSSRYTTSVTVSNPNTSWSTSVNVAANGISEISIPVAQAYTTLAETASKTGLRVVSSKPISLYASNYADASYDATNVLPLPSLTGNYIIQTYESNLFYEDIHYAKEFVIVATDNCTVDITPHARTTTGRLRNSTFSVSLKKGEVYQVLSTDENNDLSGTIVRASRPVAVFAGHQCATVPSDNEWCDHIVEQSMPVSQWGKRFPVTASMIQQANRVLVTAVSDNTEVSVNGSIVTTLGALETYEYILSAAEQSCFIETSSPAACYLYLEGGMSNNRWGDPSSVYISPVEQMMQMMTFSTFQTPRSQYHYVNIVTTADGKESIRLDGKAIRSSFAPLAGNPELVFARIKIDHGTHTLQTDVDGCTAWVYGMGDGESYAYTACSATNALDAQILVDGRSGTETELEEFCYNHPFTFTPQVNIPYSTVMWDYGDGSGKGYGPGVTHQYTAAGTYTVTMTVSNASEQQTVTTLLHLVSTRKDTVYATICKGETYVFNETEYSTSGTYPVINLQSVDGCDSIAVLKLQVNESYLFEEEKNIASGQSYRWHGNRYTEGVWYDSLLTQNGCDSVYKLTLTEVDPPKQQYDTICYEPTYVFHGHEYPIPPVDQYKDREYVDYVLEYRDNAACLTYKLFLAIVPTAEEHKEFSVTIEAGQTYPFHGSNLSASGDYTYEEPLGCHGTYSETLHLYVKPYPVIETEQVLCKQNDSYDFYGQKLTTGGIYFDTVYSVSGISELHKLTLTDQRSYHEINISTTESSYTYLGTTYTQTGTYEVVINNAAGCDSIITLNLGIGGKCKVETEWTDYICKNGSFVWNGTTYSSKGNYTQTFETAAHCDSVVTLHLLEAQPANSHFDASICQGDYYKWNGQKYDTEGPHVQTLTTVHGCDSVVTLNLTIRDTYSKTLDKTIVLGESYKWDGDEYTEEGTYTKDYIAKNGCDSVVTLNLTVLTVIYMEDKQEICEGGFYEWNGEQLTEPKDYKHTYVRPGKADSVVTLHLIVHPSYDMPAENVTVKEAQLPYRWQGVDRYQEKPYTENPKTKTFMCDSIVHLNLKVLPTIHKTIDTTICHGSYYVWKGERLTESKDDTQTITDANPEINDTVVTLHLTVLPEAKQGEETVYVFADNLPYTWHGQTLTEFKDYYDHALKTEKYKCDSSAVLHLKETAKPIIEKESDKELCAGGSINWYGKECDHTGTFESELIKGEDADTVYILHLTVWDPIAATDTTAYVCKGSTFRWHGTNYSAGATPTHAYKSKVHPDCDSTVTLKIKEYPTYELTDEDGFACYGKSFKWNDETYTTSGTYTQHLTTVHGCDSIVTRTIIIPTEPAESHTPITIFKGTGGYLWNGRTYDETGKYEYPTANAHGCDSVAYLHLTVSDKPFKDDSTEYATHCAGESFIWYEHTITARESDNTTYTHRIVGTEADTIIHLDLTVLPSYPNVEVDSTILAGTSILWNGLYCDEEKDYVAPLQTKAGCDSIVILHLTLKQKCHVTKEDSTVRICNNEAPFVIGGQSFYISTQTTVEITGAECDTTVHLDLTILPTYNKPITGMAAKGEPYVWDDDDIDTSVPGTFIITHHYTSIDGCDSTVILTLTVTEKTIIARDSTRIICEGESYEWFGTRYSATGDYAFIKNDVSSKRKFSIDGNGTQVVFAPANLQYQASTNTWRFAEHQWDYVGADNKNMAPDYDGWMDLFGWGTSGYNSSKPYITDADNTLYGDGVNDIAGTNFDWGLYNTIGDDAPGTWRCMSYNEWNYLLESRTNAVNLRGVASVNGVHGFVFLPDEWQQPAGTSFTPNANSYTTNQYDLQQWALMEAEGAIFLPAGGWRDQSTIKQAGSEGYYWTTTVLNNKDAYEFKFGTGGTSFSGTKPKYKMNQYHRYSGNTVRLVREYEEKSFVDSVYTLHLTVNPVYDIPEEYTIYAGEPFTWNGRDYSSYSPGDYHDSFTEKSSLDCDSTGRLTLHILDRIVKRSDFSQYLCPGDSYTWEGVGVFSEDNDYEHSFPIEHGDSIVTLHLHHYPDPKTEEPTVAVTCQGTPYTWHEKEYTVGGNYALTLTNQAGCDSVYATLNLTVYEPVETTDEEGYACHGESFVWDGQTYTASGTYTRLYSTVHGCDSTVTRTITIPEEPAVSHTSHSIFTGTSYRWNETDYDTSGDYDYPTTNAHGCDSTAWLHLTVKDKPVTDLTEKEIHCAGETFEWYEHTITAQENNNTSYTHRIEEPETITMIHLDLKVNPAYTDVETDSTICDGSYILWNDIRCDEAKDYVARLQTKAGCDSIVTLHLHHHPRYEGIVEKQETCEGDPWTWEGSTYTAQGEYPQTLRTIHGCDSIVTLNLTVWQKEKTEVSDTILPGEQYTLGGRQFNASGDYTMEEKTFHGCDSTVVLHLTTNQVDISAVVAEEQCADNDLLEFRVDYTGVAHEVRILFGEKAHAKGWRDTTVTIGADGTVLLPYKGKAGHYTASVELLFRGKKAAAAELALTLLYPSSVLEQGWDDAVFVLTHDYNGGYDFVDFQWYKNGKLLIGETRSYIYWPLVIGDAYSALLTEQDGTQLMTCPLIVVPHTDITLYPTLAAPSQIAHCHAHEEAEMTVYDAVGHLVMQAEVPAEGLDFEVPNTAGLYIVKIHTLSSDARRSYKLLVR